MTDTGTDLGRRLDDLAAESTDGLQLVDPSNSEDTSGSGARLALIGALVAVCLLLAIGGRLALDSGDDQDPTGGGPTSAGDSDGTDDVEVPDALRETLATSQPELDLSTARVGPTLDGRTVYSLTTSDRSVTCVVVHRADAPDNSDGTNGTTAWTCSPTYALATAGTIAGGQSDSSGTVTFGVTTDDVIGVRVEDTTALFENNLFIGDGSMDLTARELIYDPNRTAVIDGCESLGSVKESLARLRPIDPSDLDQLTRTGEQTADGADLAAVATALRPLIDERGNVERTTDAPLGAGMPAAIESCERQRVPGWVIVYASAGPLPIIDSAPLRDDFELGSYGDEQTLVESSSLESPAEGPNLSAVTGVAIDGLPVTVFEWFTYGEPVSQSCVHVQMPIHAKTSCGPEHDEPIAFEFDELADNSADDEIDADRIIAWRNTDAAFATATRQGRSYVQRAFGELFVFAVSGEGPVTLTSYDSGGDEIRSERIDPD